MRRICLLSFLLALQAAAANSPRENSRVRYPELWAENLSGASDYKAESVPVLEWLRQKGLRAPEKLIQKFPHVLNLNVKDDLQPIHDWLRACLRKTPYSAVL